MTHQFATPNYPGFSLFCNLSTPPHSTLTQIASALQVQHEPKWQAAHAARRLFFRLISHSAMEIKSGQWFFWHYCNPVMNAAIRWRKINLGGEEKKKRPPVRFKTLEHIMVVMVLWTGRMLRTESPLGGDLSHTPLHALSHTHTHSGGGVMLIDVQRLGPLSAAGAGNCLHPPPNTKQRSAREGTCFHTQPFQQGCTLPPPNPWLKYSPKKYSATPEFDVYSQSWQHLTAPDERSQAGLNRPLFSFLSFGAGPGGPANLRCGGDLNGYLYF